MIFLRNTVAGDIPPFCLCVLGALCGESVPRERLRYDVVTTQEAGFVTASDEVQLAYAMEPSRVFVTHDLHTISALLPQWWDAEREHTGVILCHLGQPESWPDNRFSCPGGAPGHDDL